MGVLWRFCGGGLEEEGEADTVDDTDNDTELIRAQLRAGGSEN